MNIELISGPNGYGIVLEDFCIAGSSGGGIMHTERKWKVREDVLAKALQRAGYKLVLYPNSPNVFDNILLVEIDTLKEVAKEKKVDVDKLYKAYQEKCKTDFLHDLIEVADKLVEIDQVRKEKK